MKYRYSIIIPYRDKYDLLLKAVASIPGRKDIQVIIVDNSDLPLPEDRVPADGPARVDYLLSDPAKGAGRARNVGLDAAEGDFILFLDADDYFSPDAFDCFDRYSVVGSDIVFFNADSINLKTGKQACRHLRIDGMIKSFVAGDHCDERLRYRFENPVPKLFLREFLVSNNIRFDEVRCSNDVMFSVRSGHLASRFTAVDTVVYVITEGERNTSLTSTRSNENEFTRFMVSLERNRFCHEIGKDRYAQRILPPIAHALKSFGMKEFFRYIKAWHSSGTGLFAGYFVK